MKLKFSPWSAVIGLLLLLMIATMLGLVPFLTPWDVLWMVLAVACVWLIVRIFLSEKKR